MANRYAVASGNYSNPAIWDNGAVPLSGDNVYANGFIIVVDQNITANIISNGVSTVRVPDIATPIMTSDISPSGIVFSSGFIALRDPYFAFDQNSSTYYQSTGSSTGILGYQYPIGKIIKRYFIRGGTSNGGPRSWTFEGSNDGITYTILETVVLALSTFTNPYTSGILANSTSYLYYRINVTMVANPGQNVTISEFEMTESTGTVLGNTNGGIFNHTSGGFTINTTNLFSNASNLLTYNHTSGVNTLNVTNNVTFNFVGVITITSGNVDITIPSITTLNQPFVGGLIKNGMEILNFIGNIFAITTSSVNYAFQLNSGIVNMTGNVTGAPAANGALVGIVLAGATLTITGNVNGGSLTTTGTGAHAISQSSGNLTIIGNVTTVGGLGAAHGVNQSGGNLTVIGSITGGTGDLGLGVSSSTFGNITVTGTITSGTTNVGLFSSNRGATVNISGPLVNINGFAALYAPKYFITSPSTTITTQSSIGVNNIFYNDTSVLDALLASNVRDGISFGLGGSLTGTLKVPLPSQVVVGVETDNTVGTWALIPEDFWNYLTSNTFASGSMGDRMKNVSTVASTGAQIASYSV